MKLCESIASDVQWPRSKDRHAVTNIAVSNLRSPATPLVAIFLTVLKGEQTMKKLLLTATCLAALTGAARADDRPTWQDYFEFNPYVGADYQYTNYSYNSDYNLGGGLALDGDSVLNKDLSGGNIHVGNRFNKFVGVELGYFYNAAGDKSVTAGSTVGPGTVATGDFKTKVQTQGGTLDLMGYLPVGPKDRFDLIGTGGATWTHAKLDLNVPGAGSSGVSDNEWGWRAGGGVQFHLTPQLNLRGLVRYQSADFKDIADHAVTYTVGLNYEF